MSYLDNGEDEVDYGEAEDPNPAFPGGVQGSAYADDDDALQEDAYEDLYDDVNIRYFEPSAAEISSPKNVAVHGEENLGASIPEDEASIDHVKGLSTDSGALVTQQNTQLEIQPGKAPGFLVKNAAPVKEEGSVVQSDDTLKTQGVAKISPSVNTPQQQVTVTLDAKPKLAGPGISISINQSRLMDEKDAVLPSLDLQASASVKAKDESDPARTAMEVNVASASAYPSHPIKGNSMTSAEPPVRLASSPMEYERNVTPEKFISGKPITDNNTGRARGPLDTDRGYAGDGKSTQVVSNRDFGSLPPQNEYTVKHNVPSHNSGGGTMLFIGELHWWTTDVELETALLEFGALKNLKFYEERASGKSKGYCQVEFYDHSAALACKEGMNGRKFHGRPCLVAFANQRTIMQMGTAQVEKAQAQLRAQQAQVQARKTMNDTSGSNRSTATYQGGDNNRSYGRSSAGAGRGSHGQAVSGRGPARGRTNTSSKGLSGNGGNVGSVPPYGQGLVGPMGSHPSGMMMPQAMMGQGYDPGYGPPRGSSGYGGYVLPGPHFTGMVQPFPTMGPGSLPGVAPHVNPAFFGRNSTANGMGIMGGSGMEGSQSAMWGDANMSGWGADEHDRRSYDDDAADSDYTYSNELAYEKSRGADELSRADAEWPERRRPRERDLYRDQRDREREQDKDDWDRDKAWRLRNRSRGGADEDDKDDLRMRTREEEYGKRLRLGSDR